MSERVPEGWTHSTVGESALNVSKKYDPSEDGNPRYIGLEHVAPSTKYLRRWGYADNVISTKSVFEVGDTLFGKLRPYLKKVSIADFKGICSTDILVIRAKNTTCPEFLYRILSSEDAISHSVESSAGNVMPRTSWKDMAEYQFVKPLLPEQSKIAAILSSVDDVIEKTQTQIKKLADLKTGIMQELLTKGIGHTEFKDSPVGRIPVGWNVKCIGDLLEFKNGLNKEKKYFGRGNHIVNFTDVFHSYGIRAKDLDGKVELTESEQKRFSVKKGDVFFTRTSETPDEIGMSAVFLDKAKNVSFSGFVLRGRPITDDLIVDFCKYCFSSDYVRRQIVSSCSYTTRALTNGPLLSQVEVAIPPKDEQKKVHEAIDSVVSKLGVLAKKIQSLKSIKKALMQDLLTGKVRVPIN